MKDIKATPLVTVYMPTHNRLTNLKRAIESVKQQSYTNWELLIVNDGSSDGTFEYLQGLDDSRIKVFHNESPQGACFARNVAINNAMGEFITGLDDDDEFTFDRLSFFINSWQEKYSFLCTPVTVCRNEKQQEHLYFIGEISLQDMLVVNKVGNQIFCKTEALKEINGFDASFKAWQDYDTWVRFLQRFGTGLKLPKSTYYQHESQSAASITRSPNRLTGFSQFLAKHQSLMSPSQLKAMECWRHIISGTWVPLSKLIGSDKGILKYSILHNCKLLIGR
ncbi:MULTISPECIES: glycosyltransferase [unclassified Pseudoalteromonas]|uniref:glycosyltransferase n=1 Tax=unclassified Pseudoalteromonas TaxID=194690 RepID=UPI0030152092